jgi:transposase InsO family protein
MAVTGGHVKRGAIVHTDRGSQYGSNEYLRIIEERGLRASMSPKGNCWDNAWPESFFATLEKELVGDGVLHGPISTPPCVRSTRRVDSTIRREASMVF